MKIIQITGTPCTGKTKIAKAVCSLLRKQNIDAHYINITGLVKKNRLYLRYDRKTRSYVVDEKKLIKFFDKFILDKKDLTKVVIIDSHIIFLDRKHMDLCFVINTDLKILNKRLKMRKYAKQKIKDNLDAEIFDFCYTECIDRKYKKIIKLKNDTRTDLTKNITLILKKIKSLT